MERAEFLKLLEQEVILENLVLTGLRGVGKTVLLDTFRPLAIEQGWLWAGTDLSEAASVTEERIALRMITDLAAVTSLLQVSSERLQIGFGNRRTSVARRLDFDVMGRLYERTPGLPADKIKAVLEFAWSVMRHSDVSGVIFAYDEAQNMADHAARNEYPLSLMLDVFQSIQKKGIPFMLLLTGLPTLFPKLVEARTYSERMFHVLFLHKLNEQESRQAIVKPTEKGPIRFTEDTVKLIIQESGGYPYFIQFICREVFDAFRQHPNISVPLDDIIRKLDTDFFAGRWAKVSDRQRDLLGVIASLDGCDEEFTVQEVSQKSKEMLDKGFSPSYVSQMFSKLQDSGLIFKNRHGKYAFAVPLLHRFILRQIAEG